MKSVSWFQKLARCPIHASKPIIGGRLFDIETGVITHYTTIMQGKGIKPVPVPFLPELVGRDPMKYVIGKRQRTGNGRVFLNQIRPEGYRWTD